MSPVFDWNADGRLVYTEFATQWRTLFDRADRDRNGIVDPKSWRVMCAIARRGLCRIRHSAARTAAAGIAVIMGRTIAALAADLAAGKTTSRALVEAALAAIARDGSAFTRVDAERARAEADASDRQRAQGAVVSANYWAILTSDSSLAMAYAPA